MQVAEQVEEILTHPAAPVRTAAMALPRAYREAAIQIIGSPVLMMKLLRDLGEGGLDLGRKSVLRGLIWKILKLCETELNPAAGASREEKRCAQEVFEMCWRTLPRLR